LVVGNSLPVRGWTPSCATARDIGVVCQRGTNGIDGLIRRGRRCAFCSEADLALLVT
jgi:2-succinyl-5-enolpyruvyl-6-hydroxy-3-cyclohexene-1-carboxylate synthase